MGGAIAQMSDNSTGFFTNTLTTTSGTTQVSAQTTILGWPGTTSGFVGSIVGANACETTVVVVCTDAIYCPSVIKGIPVSFDGLDLKSKTNQFSSSPIPKDHSITNLATQQRATVSWLRPDSTVPCKAHWVRRRKQYVRLLCLHQPPAPRRALPLLRQLLAHFSNKIKFRSLLVPIS